MNPLVLDASVAVSWIALSQSNPNTQALLRNVRAHAVMAPHLFPAEVRNALLKLERTGALQASETDQGLAGLALVEIEVEPPLSVEGVDRVLEWARSERVSLFDALYIDLARRSGAKLASRDRRQLEAAVRMRVPVIDLRRTPA